MTKYRGPLAKPLPPEKPRKRIRPMSAKRQKESRIYNEMVKAFLKAHPICFVCLDLKVAKPQPSTQNHHIKGRFGSNYLDMATWMAVCAPHHDEIGRRKAWAMERGYLKSFIA